MHLLNVPEVPLTVNVAAGHGEVLSDVPGVACTSSCTSQWDPGSQVSLSAAPAAGARFIGWSGAGCSGVGDCAVTLQSAQTVAAVFGPATISVKATTAGRGTVYCVPRCSTRFRAGSPLSLIAQPAKGWKFVRWSGACKGTQPICHPSTNASLTAKATFKKKPTPLTKKR